MDKAVRDTRGAWWGAVVIGGGALWLAGFLFARWPAPLFANFNSNSPIDAAFFAWAGQAVRHGGTPYLTFWDHKPPLVFLIDAGALSISAGRVWGIWLVSLATLVATLVLGYAAMRRLFATAGTPGAAFGAVAFAASVPAIMPSNLTEQYVLPLEMGALLVFARAREAPHRSLGAGFALGVLGGLSFMLRQNLFGAELIAAVVLAWLMLRAAGAGAVLRLIMGGVLGALAVMLPIVLWLWARGALGAFYDQAFHYNNLYTAVSVKARVRAAYDGLRMATGTLPLVVPLAGWLLAARRLVRGGGPADRATLLLAIAWLPLELALASVSGRAYAHYFATLLPPLALLSGYLVAEIAAALAPSVLRAAALVGALGAALAIPVALDLAVSLRADGLPRARAAQVAAVAGYVRRTTAPDARVLVWGHAADVLLLSDRRPASRFVYPLPLLTPRYADSALVASFLADLRASDPPVIIDATPNAPPGDDLVPSLGTWNPGWRYPPAATGSGSTSRAWWHMTPALHAFYDYVSAHYVLADSIGPERWAVYRLR
ncbi:MAG TPA: glycosyltransferase family 39 protein [Gemmatimonadales bacterium]|nr:glycosyltransferase family 39 protein [Gemmatimonadales bacterium]